MQILQNWVFLSAGFHRQCVHFELSNECDDTVGEQKANPKQMHGVDPLTTFQESWRQKKERVREVREEKEKMYPRHKEIL